MSTENTETTYIEEARSDEAPLTWAAPFVVLAGGIGIGLLVIRLPAFFTMATAGAVILGLLLVRNLQFGLIGLFYISALALGETPGVQSPNSTYSQGLMPSQLLLGFLIMLWVGRGALSGGFRLRKSALNLPMVLLLAVAVVSLLTNNLFRATRELLFHQMLITQVAEVGLLAFSISAFLLASSVFQSERWINRIFPPIVIMGCITALSQVTAGLISMPFMWASFLMAAAIAFVYSRLLFSTLSTRQKVGLSLLLILLMAGVMVDLRWLSGWMACMGVMLVVTWVRSKPLALGLVLCLLFMMFVYPGVYQSIHEESASGGDFDRFTIWHDAFLMVWGVNPILGVGPGNYHPYVYWHNTIWFGSGTYTTAHSNYAQMFAELGLLGLAAFIWVIVAAICTGMKAYRTSAPEHRWLGVSAVAMVSALAVASLFGDYLFPSRGNNGIATFGTTVYTWLILGAAVAASYLGKEPQAVETADELSDRRSDLRKGGPEART